MTSQRPEWYVGMDADTIYRARASDGNLQGIIEGRRRAALALLVTDQTLANQTRVDTAALLGEKYTGHVPASLEIPYVPPPAQILGRAELLTGEGPPPDDADDVGPGDEYLDTVTGDVYTQTDDA